jgi:hypothetical protein
MAYPMVKKKSWLKVAFIVGIWLALVTLILYKAKRGIFNFTPKSVEEILDGNFKVPSPPPL